MENILPRHQQPGQNDQVCSCLQLGHCVGLLGIIIFITGTRLIMALALRLQLVPFRKLHSQLRATLPVIDYRCQQGHASSCSV